MTVWEKKAWLIFLIMYNPSAVSKGRTVLVALPGGMPFDGGVPVIWNNQVIGAVGVSCVTATQDGMIAQAGADALEKIVK
ncbi:heme-binding protein [Bacteroidota bacterium]